MMDSQTGPSQRHHHDLLQHRHVGYLRRCVYLHLQLYRFILGPCANYTPASMYAMSRKVLGYNTWFSED